MSRRIVVLNHHDNTLKLFRAILASRGFELHTFKEETTALQDIDALRPDLIILGHIRGVSSTEAEIVRALRANPLTAPVPIIVVTTGAALVERIVEQEGFPMVQVLEKPFDASRLLNAVNAMLAVP
jgi:CheY-like chemotaxis protein